MTTQPIDLRTCKPGDKLLSKRGLILTYLGASPYNNSNYPHLVEYPGDGDENDDEGYQKPSHGTRSDDGRVSVVRSLPTDHDIVEIIPS